MEYKPVIEKEGYIALDDNGKPDLRNDGYLLDVLCFPFRVPGGMKLGPECSPSITPIAKNIWIKSVRKLQNKLLALYAKIGLPDPITDRLWRIANKTEMMPTFFLRKYGIVLYFDEITKAVMTTFKTDLYITPIDTSMTRERWIWGVNHEFGHMMGLRDTTFTNSVMQQGGSAPIFPTQLDIDEVKTIYPLCKPVPKNFSISFSPNPAVWEDTSPPVGQCGPNGNMIVYNRKWSTRLTIQAPSSGDITITDRRLKVFDASGLRTILKNDNPLNWWFKKDSNNSYSFFIYPFTFLPTRAELTLSGKDDKGNPVTSTASVNLQQGNYYHISANCTKKETGDSVSSVWGAFGSSCDPSRCE